MNSMMSFLPQSLELAGNSVLEPEPPVSATRNTHLARSVEQPELTWIADADNHGKAEKLSIDARHVCFCARLRSYST